MARLFSLEDIEFLGYRNPKITDDGPGWTRVAAKLEAGLVSVETEFVYLKADCTTDHLQTLVRNIGTGGKVYVLLPPSHKLTLPSIIAAFGNKAASVLGVEDGVWKALATLFKDFISSSATNITDEPYFVPARKEKEPRAELDKELIAYLSGRGNIPPGTLAVVSASAGVGKTTVARKAALALVRKANEFKIIPVFVEAAHWRKFNLQANLEIWDIIRNSIDHFGGPIGISQDLFNYGLKQGYFVFIFDGFDELCGPKHSQFSPIDVLRFLADLAKQSEARILITTRTLFWQNEIEKVGVPENVSILTLAPFNTAQAKGYFQERFKSDLKKRAQAQTLYSKLVKSSDLPENEEGGARAKFANLPLVVGMLGEYVDQGGIDFESQGHIIEELLSRLCLRDKARQDLLTAAQEQIKSFEEIAVEWFETVNPDFDEITLGAAGFPKEDIRDIRHHSLVAAGRSPNTLCFRWDFLAPYLRASYLRRTIRAGTSPLPNSAQRIMQSEANGKGFVFEHLCGLLDSNDLSDVTNAYRSLGTGASDARSFLIHLLLALIEADKDLSASAIEKTKVFLGCLGQNNAANSCVTALSIVGQVERLDLRGIQFKECEFKNVAFVNCTVSATTLFDRCTFTGELELNPSQGWEFVTVLPNCTVRSPASLTLNSVLQARITDASELLMDALSLGLGKFWHNGSPKDLLKRDDWKRGLLGRTKYCEPILDALVKAKVISNSATGQYSEPKLIFSKESFGELQRFMDNRQLTGRLADAYRRLSTSGVV